MTNTFSSKRREDRSPRNRFVPLIVIFFLARKKRSVLLGVTGNPYRRNTFCFQRRLHRGIRIINDETTNVVCNFSCINIFNTFFFSFNFPDLPREGPYITGDKSVYQFGDSINLNCTSAKSYPASKLHWYINNLLVSLLVIYHDNIVLNLI